MKKFITIFILFIPCVVFSKTLTCKLDQGFSGNDTRLDRSLGDPLPIYKIPSFGTSEPLVIDFENRKYGKKRIINVSSIENEVFGTVLLEGVDRKKTPFKYRTEDKYLLFHYNKITKKLIRIHNSFMYHDYLKKDVTMIDMETYDCN